MNLRPLWHSKRLMQRASTRWATAFQRALAPVLAVAVFALLAPTLPAIAAADEQAAEQAGCGMQSISCAIVCQPARAAAADTAQVTFPAAHPVADTVPISPAPKLSAAVPRGVLSASGPPPFLRYQRLLL